MSDTLRVIEFSVGGRPVEILNLEDGANYVKERDSFAITPPPKRPRTVAYQQRYGGQRVVGEAHDNGTIGAMWRVAGTSADNALINAETLIQTIDASVRGRYIEWKPEGATRPVYFEVRGPGTWTPTYRNVLFAQRSAAQIQATWPVAPLALGAPLDVFDDFSVDSISDYSFDLSGGTLSVSGGQLVPSDTTEKRLYHSARGYRYADFQATLKFTTGASANPLAGIGLTKRLDSGNFLMAQVNPSVQALQAYKYESGGFTQLGSNVSISALATTTSYWLRVRIEGNVLTAEWWTAAPTPMGTPATTLTYTLAGADATKYGANVMGDVGMRLSAVPTDWRLDDFTVEPFTYRNQTLPASISLGGSVPGDATALCDLEVTPSGGSANPVFALAGWTKRARTPLASTSAPFGILEAEAAGDLSAWAVQADGTARGGSRLNDTTPTSAETFTASWQIDPSVFDPREFSEADYILEAWARVLLTSSLVSPRLTLSARPAAGLNFGAERFTNEYGSTGKLLTLPSSGTVYRFVRLGTLVLRTDPNRPIAWKLWLAGSLGAGSAGTAFGIDYLTLVRAPQRAASPSGKANDASYPAFTASTSETRRIIKSSLAGLTAQPPNNPVGGPGLGGSRIELPTGNVDALVKLSSLAADDGTVDATTEQLSHSASVHFAVQPRFLLARGS